MALKESEAIVLRTYPLRESDLLVTLFTRMGGQGKRRGARGHEVERRALELALSRSRMCAPFTMTASGRTGAA